MSVVLISDSRQMSSGADALNLQSTLNTRAAASLAAGSTFTGTWEPCSAFNCVSIVVRATSTNMIGHLSVEFASDSLGSTVLLTRKSRIMDDELNKIYVCQVVSAYYRVKFAAATIIDTRATPIANTFAGLSVSTFLHTQPLPFADFVLGQTAVRLQGYDAFTNSDRIIGKNCTAATVATFPMPATNTTLRVRNTGTGNSAAGAGARTFLVIGLNAVGEEVFWKGDFVASGTDLGEGGGVTLPTTSSFTRVNDFRILTVGSSKVPTSNSVLSVEIYDSSYKTVGALEPTCSYKYDTAFYTVPAGCTAYLATGYLSTSVTSGTTMRVSRIRSGTLQSMPLIYNVACSQLEYMYPEDMHVVAATAGESVVAEMQSTNAIVTSVDFILWLVSY